MTAILTKERWNYKAVLICIFLMDKGVKHFQIFIGHFIILFLNLYMHMCLVCGCMYVSAVANRGQKRAHWIPAATGSFEFICAGNQTPIFYESSLSSYPLNQFSSFHLYFFWELSIHLISPFTTDWMAGLFYVGFRTSQGRHITALVMCLPHVPFTLAQEIRFVRM